MVIKINIPRTPQPPPPPSPHFIPKPNTSLFSNPLHPSPSPCCSSEGIWSPLCGWIYYNLINSSLPKLDKKKMHCTWIWAYLSTHFFFTPFLTDSYQYILVFTSWLCLHESGMILFSQNVYCVDQQMIHILLYFVDLFLIFHGMLFHSFALQLNV